MITENSQYVQTNVDRIISSDTNTRRQGNDATINKTLIIINNLKAIVICFPSLSNYSFQYYQNTYRQLALKSILFIIRLLNVKIKSEHRVIYSNIMLYLPVEETREYFLFTNAWQRCLCDVFETKTFLTYTVNLKSTNFAKFNRNHSKCAQKPFNHVKYARTTKSYVYYEF